MLLLLHKGRRLLLLHILLSPHSLDARTRRATATANQHTRYDQPQNNRNPNDRVQPLVACRGGGFVGLGFRGVGVDLGLAFRGWCGSGGVEFCARLPMGAAEGEGEGWKGLAGCDGEAGDGDGEVGFRGGDVTGEGHAVPEVEGDVAVGPARRVGGAAGCDFDAQGVGIVAIGGEVTGDVVAVAGFGGGELPPLGVPV